MANLAVWCVLVAAMSVLGLLFPELFWRAGSWRYRNADAMEPTAAQYNLYRARFAALLTLAVPPLIGMGWPGPTESKVNAWVVTAVGSVLLYVAVLIVIAIVRSKSARSTIDHSRPSELSEAGYGEQWFIVGYTLFCTLLIVVVFGGISAQQAQQAQERAEESGLTDAELEAMMEEITAGWPTAVPPTFVEHPGLPVYAATDGLFVLDATRVQSNADGALRVGAPLNTCPIAGVVAVESSVNVSFGVVYDASGAKGVDAAAFCVPVADANTFELVPVPTVLGERAALTLSGNKLQVRPY